MGIDLAEVQRGGVTSPRAPLDMLSRRAAMLFPSDNVLEDEV